MLKICILLQKALGQGQKGFVSLSQKICGNDVHPEQNTCAIRKASINSEYTTYLIYYTYSIPEAEQLQLSYCQLCDNIILNIVL